MFILVSASISFAWSMLSNACFQSSRAMIRCVLSCSEYAWILLVRKIGCWVLLVALKPKLPGCKMWVNHSGKPVSYECSVNCCRKFAEAKWAYSWRKLLGLPFYRLWPHLFCFRSVWGKVAFPVVVNNSKSITFALLS